MTSKAATVDAYLRELEPDRREGLSAIRKAILENLNEDITEQMQYGMIGYVIPHSVYPAGYHCDPKQPLPFAGLASQKNHIALYAMCVYMNRDLQEWLAAQFAARKVKLDMGKSCVRFKKLSDVPLDVIGALFRKMTAKAFIDTYEATLSRGKTTAKKAKA